MVRNPLLPRAQGPIVGGQPPTTEYRTFFEQLAQAVIDAGGTASDVAELSARVAALEASGTISFNTSPGSIQVSGGPDNFIISLRGDNVAPGVTCYYGTGPDGVKGWFAVESAIEVDSGELTKAVGADGVTTLGLASVGDSGSGALLAIIRDGFGRVTGTKAATITAGSGISVANGDAVAGLPTVSHADTSSVANLSSDNSGTVVLQDIALTFDAFGHVMGATVGTVDVASALSGIFQPLDTTLTALAGQNWAANAIPIGSGADTVAQVSFAANTFPARASTGNLVAKSITDGALGALAGTSGTATFLRSDGTSSDTLTGSLTLLSGADTVTTGGLFITGASSGSGYCGLTSNGRMTIGNSQSTTTNLDIDPQPGDGTSTSNFRFFRNVNTTGIARFQIYLGDNTSTLNAQIHGKGDNSYLCANNGNLGVGTSTPTAGKLVVAGNYAASVDNTYSSGTATNRHSVVYAGTGTINTSDEREKDAITPFTPGEVAAAKAMAAEIGTYHWLSALQEKGDGARTHIGLTVQRAIEIMRTNGLDPLRYGFICHDAWDELPEVWREIPEQEAVYGEGGVLIAEAEPARKELVQEYRPAGDRYSFRHDQLALFLVRGIHERIAALEALTH